MRPYLAIIQDSFREALASRVLWILLVLATLVLLVLAPVSVDEVPASRLRRGDVLDAEELSRRILQEQAAPEPTPGKQIWALLNDDLKRRLASPDEGSGQGNWPGRRYAELAAEMNDLLAKPQLYDRQAWAGKSLDPEAQRLLAAGIEHLERDDLARLNRLLLEAAYPNQISHGRSNEIALGYLGYRPFPSFPGRRKEIIDSIISATMTWFVGLIGIFVAILVTASIIPHTFEPGAIDLLLSKPVSRWLVFLTKYVGGCIFTLINAGYMVAGLWLIAGTRLGVWNAKLLLCAPLLLFLFAIYYSISALAGALWKNAIVAVVLSIVFYFVCLGVGLAKGWTEFFGLNYTRLVRLVPAGDELFAANEAGQIERWDTPSAAWKEVLAAEAGVPQPPRFFPRPPMIGLVYDAGARRLLAAPAPFGQFGPARGASGLFVGSADDGWKRATGVGLPAGTSALFMTPQGELLAVSHRGFFRLAGDPVQEGKTIKAFGFEIPMAAGASRFVQVSAELSLHTPFSAALDPKSGDVAVYDRKQVTLFERAADGRYRTRLSQERDDDKAAALALADGKLLVASADGRVELYAGRDLSQVQVFQPAGVNSPRFAEASPDGRYFAVVFHNRRLWLYDTLRRQAPELRIAGQGDISAAAFSPDQLLVADRFARVSEYQLDDGQLVRRDAPSRGMLELVYTFAIKPIYTVFPQPGELGNMVNYLLTGSQSVALTDRRDDLGAARYHLDIWGPIWSNVAFVAVVVGLGCWYTQRKDF